VSTLSAHGVGVAHGDFDVFSGISLSIPDDAKIGLVGPNGIGKTTLLRVLAGASAPTSGSMQRARGLRIGYLRQEAVEAFAGRTHTIHDEMLTVFADLLRQAAQLGEWEARMASHPSEDLLRQYGAAQEAFEHAGGYEYELRIKSVLEGLGFARSSWETPIHHLSGGQKTRVLLARLLLEAPELLIMDEPTNHLDVAAIEWLENTLTVWKGALLVVSHDRYFLDKVVDRIYEMGKTRVEVYRGNYSAYVGQRQERWERAQQVFVEEKERLTKELDYIRKNIAGQRTDMAKGKLKRLGRELLAIEQLGPLGMVGKSWSETGLRSPHMMSVEEAERRLAEFRLPDAHPPRLNMRLKAAARSGDIVLRTEGIEVGYPGKRLFAAQDIQLLRKECAALIGPNGAGKTTFLRTLLGELEPLAGQARLGANLKVGYFAQAHDALNPENSVIDEIMAHPGMTLGTARDHLAQYLFRGEDAFKPVKALSGGERGRLALAVLALQGANFLLLDEPTNHLDIPSQEVLQEGMEAFGGTLLMVSHDRYLVDRLATQIWELRDGRLHVFPGPYQEYLADRERAALAQKEAAVRPTPSATARGTERPVSDAREARKRAQQVAALEDRIAQLEDQLEQQGHKLQQEGSARHYQEVRLLSEAYAATEQQLSALMDQWTELAATAS